MKRVLIVEDDPVWANIFESYSRQEGFDVTSVSSPQMAMDELDSKSPDVIVLDMLLAAETGMALLNEMRGYPDLVNIPIIVCSSVDGIELAQLKDFGVKYVLNKSEMTDVDFKSAIRNLADE